MKNDKQPEIRLPGFTEDWEQRKFGEIINERREKSKVENEDILLSSAIDGMYLNSELFSHFRGTSNIGYLKIRKNDMILSAQNLHLGNCNINKRFDHGIISPAYKVYSLVDVDVDFIHAWIKKDSTKQFFEKATTEGASVCRKNIEWGTLYNQKMYIPIYSEQQKIGAFFKQMDDTITLHQQELDTLTQTKQGFLQKMFPKEGESVPDLRFSGFTDDWKLVSLDSLVDRIKSYSLSRAVETKENTGYKYIHYGDIHTNVAGIVDESSNLPNIQDGNYELLKKGDLVLADASEDYQGIATPALINIETPYNLVAGLHTIALRSKIEKVDSLFLYYLIKSPIFKRYGYKAGTGMKVFGISVTNLLKFEGFFPTVDEQKKIGAFLKNLEEVIALHQQELDVLKQTKKAFLQKMFV